MPRFLIEVPHDENEEACAHVVERFLNYGSHFAVNADWGCMDGVHKAWITLETDTREDALATLPPAHRAAAKIIQLNKFSMEQIAEVLAHHKKNG